MTWEARFARKDCTPVSPARPMYEGQEGAPDRGPPGAGTV